jgi:uncharacterized membrane protein
LPAFSLDSEDSQIFIAGFNAYQKKDFAVAIENMSSLLKKYPGTPLRDMAIFWLARANYKAGNQQEAAKYMAQFFREYPASPLKGTVEDDLVTLANHYERGESLAALPQKVEPPAGKATKEKTASAKAEVAQGSAQKAEPARTATATAATEKVAKEKIAAEEAAAEKVAVAKVETERAAAVKALAEKLAQEKAEAERLTASKAEQNRKAAIEQTAQLQPAAKVSEVVAAKKGGAKGKRAKALVMREKAIAGYKVVIDRFPGSAAAASATAKLQQMGVDYPPLSMVAAAPPVVAGETAQIFTLEVAQFADAKLQIGAVPESLEAGKRFAIPFEVVNLGNGSDSFYLESGFPPEYDFHFAAATAPDTPINSTPNLAGGERFTGVAIGTMPRGNIDGQKSGYPVKVTSRVARDISQSREIRLVASAPLLRAVVKTDKAKLLPGERVTYRIDLLNIGTAVAGNVALRLNYPSQYEPVEFIAAGFKQELKAALVLDGLKINSGESKEFTVVFQLKEEALAQQELFLRADVINSELDKKDSFLSTASVVQSVSGVTARSTAEKLVVIPGQTVAIPLIVTNTGNLRENFAIKANVPDSVTHIFFQDLNRDGKKQSNEPIISNVGALAPREEAYVVLEITTPKTGNDGVVIPLAVLFEPDGDKAKRAGVNLQVVFSRPVLALTMAAKGGRLKPGEVSSLELDCLNNGSNMAMQVYLQSIIPSQLELVAADPEFSKTGDGVYSWRFDQLGAGEKRSIKITYRVKAGTAVGTNMQLKNILNYQDQLGNRY